MTYTETLDWLFNQLPMYQRQGAVAYKADLSNTLKLMSHLGNPEKSFKSVHVGGTNGKGSVSHSLAAIFQEAGYKTGLYTSPHLKDFRERIRINGQMISKEEVINFIELNKPFFEQESLSFFEMTVGMAFDYFRKEMVDIAIIEVGMGGRLDSTNVIKPELSIITNISLDHVQFLGNTLTAIAGEKAGIIKPDRPVVIGERDTETETVFKAKAKQMGSPIHFASDFHPKPDRSQTELKGEYQQQNLSTLLTAIDQLEELGYALHKYIKPGLQNITKLTGLRGRWETLQQEPLVICDTGHNEAGVRLITQQLKKLEYDQLHIVWGTVNDKDSARILGLLPKEASYFWCEPSVPRAKSVKLLKAEAAKVGLKGDSFQSATSALEQAKKLAKTNDLIFVGGSTFVVADVL